MISLSPLNMADPKSHSLTTVRRSFTLGGAGRWAGRQVHGMMKQDVAAN